MLSKRRIPLGSAVAATMLASSLAMIPALASAASPSAVIPLPPISSLDTSQWGNQILLDQGTIMEGLTGYNAKNHVVLKIASKIVSSHHERDWTIYLRHNARWSNGKPVTAQDFYDAWMYVASPKNPPGAVWASVMQYVLNSYAYKYSGIPASQVGIKVVNPYELHLTLSTPHNITSLLALTSSMPIYPPDLKAHPGTFWTPKYFVGDGPYLVKSFVPNGQIVLARNPQYVGASGQMNVGNIQSITIEPTSSVPVEDFLAGKLSAAVIQTTSDYRYVQGNPKLKADLHVAPTANINYLEWDKSPQPSPLYNVNVRRAVALAINRSPIVNSVLAGMAGSANTFAYPGWPTAKLERPVGYNVQEARRLLAKAGYANGKNLPTIYLYTETQANNPTWINVAEAIAQELKQNLNMTVKIEPTAQTQYGLLQYQGVIPGFKPGYLLNNGVANWSGPSQLELQSYQIDLFDGTIGTQHFVQHAAQNWYFPNYDPHLVKLLGNPANANSGIHWSQWGPLKTLAAKDISALNAWLAKQPAAYQRVLKVPGAVTNQEEWNNLVKDFHTATSNAARHQAFVAAWKFVGNGSAGNGDASVGLNGQVYEHRYGPKAFYLTQMWLDESRAVSPKKADQLAAELTNMMTNQGYVIPLYYSNQYSLVSPSLTGVQTNPY